jgi:hypothetical protein
VSKILIQTAYGGGSRKRNRRRFGTDIAPYSQQLGDFFTGSMSVLVKSPERIYSAGLGMADLTGAKSR